MHRIPQAIGMALVGYGFLACMDGQVVWSLAIYSLGIGLCLGTAWCCYKQRQKSPGSR